MRKVVSVPRGSTVTLGFIDGDLHVGGDSTIKAEEGLRSTTVSGIVRCEGECFFNCGLIAESLDGHDGDITVEGDLSVNKVRVRKGGLHVIGNLSAKTLDVDRKVTVEKNLNVERVRVGGSLEVRGDTKALDVEVGGSYKASGNVEMETINVGGTVDIGGAVKGLRIEVGGSFRGGGLVEVKKITVGGAVRVEAEVKIEDIDVGGMVVIKGGEVKDRINVGGTFESTGPLKFNKIDVGGAVKLSNRCEGGSIDVGGSLKVDGDLVFTSIDVGGSVEITGDARGENIDVGGRLNVGRSLSLSGRLDVGGSAEIGNYVKVKSVDVGGSLKASTVEALDAVKVGGLIETLKGVKANYIEIGRRGEVRGPLIGVNVLVRERARIEDVYADTLTLEENSKARNIYARRIYVESGCRILGEVQYTELLEREEGVLFAQTPVKVEKLPPPPL